VNASQDVSRLKSALGKIRSILVTPNPRTVPQYAEGLDTNAPTSQVSQTPRVMNTSCMFTITVPDHLLQLEMEKHGRGRKINSEELLLEEIEARDLAPYE